MHAFLKHIINNAVHGIVKVLGQVDIFPKGHSHPCFTRHYTICFPPQKGPVGEVQAYTGSPLYSSWHN